MNWQRGMLRLWMLVTILGLAFCAWQVFAGWPEVRIVDTPLPTGVKPLPPGFHLDNDILAAKTAQRQEARNLLTYWFGIGLAVPAFLLFSGVAFKWLVEGFNSSPKP